MVVARQSLAVDASLILDVEEYALDDAGNESPVQREPAPVQPGEMDTEFERRLMNLAMGWGQAKYSGPGGYNYGDGAILHRRLSWLPGSTVTVRTDATIPIGPVSFCEYWDGTDANRRLIIVTPRHVYEVHPDGTCDDNDLGVAFTLARGMTKGVSFRTGGMTAPKIFIARPSTTLTDYMVSRTAANTYAVSGANKYMAAVGEGKDPAGAQVLWRVDENGKLNQSVADSDPDSGASWSGASYPASNFPLGSTNTRVNDIVQQSKSMVAGKPDGAWTFDNVLNTIPLTRGMEQAMDAANFKWFKDANGMAIAPTLAGLVWLDGLEWGVCGPVSSNPEARNLRGIETAATSDAGNYGYSSVYYGGDSYIFMRTPRKETDTGSGPFTWHGPIAKIASQKVTDLKISTVWGKKLWIGYVNAAGDTGGWGTIALNDDLSPVPDAATGYIYLPEGILDMSGPGVIKDLRKAEFIAPADAPFAATNAWTVEVDTGSGYTAIDGGSVTSGTYAERFWSTETSGRRPRVRLKYSGNTGSAELEQVIIRGTERPETTDLYTFRLRLKDGPKMPSGKRLPKTALGQYETLRGLLDLGRKVAVVYGETTFTGKVTYVSDVSQRKGLTGSPEYVVTVRVRRVKTS